MKPEFSPGFGVRNAGKPDSAGSTSIAIRRSAIEPISQSAERDHVRCERDRFGMEVAAGKRGVSSAKISGLSETPLASSPEWRQPGAARQAPRPSPVAGSAGNTGPARARRQPNAKSRMRLPAIRARNAAAVSICPRCLRSGGCADRTAHPIPSPRRLKGPRPPGPTDKAFPSRTSPPAHRQWRTGYR